MVYNRKLWLYVVSILCVCLFGIVWRLWYSEFIKDEQKIELEKLEALIHDKNYSWARTVLYSYFSGKNFNETGFSINWNFLSMLEYGSIAFSSGHSYEKMNILKSKLTFATSSEQKSYYLVGIWHIYFERLDKLSDDIERGIIKEDDLITFLNLLNAKKALAAYNESLLYNPENVDAMMHKWVLIFDIWGSLSEQAKESEKLFKKILDIDPLNHLAWYRLWNLLSDRQDYKWALYYFNKSIEIYPYHDRARNNKWIAEGNLWMSQEAIKSYTKAIEVYNPNFNPRWWTLQNIKASALYNRWREYYLLLNRKKWEADIRAALEENPLHSMARDFLKTIELSESGKLIDLSKYIY